MTRGRVVPRAELPFKGNGWRVDAYEPVEQLRGAERIYKHQRQYTTPSTPSLFITCWHNLSERINSSLDDGTRPSRGSCRSSHGDA